jgi:microcystin-dependent protein
MSSTTRLTFSNITPARVFSSTGNDIYYTGNVGIGKSNPAVALDVSGNMTITGNTTICGSLVTSESLSLNLGNTNAVYSFGSNAFVIDTFTNRIGIGKTNPSVLLDISGNTTICGTLYVSNINGNDLGTGSIATQWTTSGSDIFYRTGNVGIGKSGPTATLDVSGTVNVNQNRFTIRSSSQTYQYNIRLNGLVRAMKLKSDTSQLYIGGDFTEIIIETVQLSTNIVTKIDVYRAFYIASISTIDSTVNTLGSGLNGSCYAIDISGSNIYVGGSFSLADNVANTVYIARWGGTAWNALGSGLNNWCNAIVTNGNDVYVGGSFSSAGGVSGTPRIARWDGSAWNALGTGLGSTCLAIAVVSSTNIYAGGSFSSPSRIAQWNGSSWVGVGAGLNGACAAIAVSGSNVYAGGSFTLAGSVTGTAYIARWDGANWYAMGTGLNNVCNTIAVSGSNVYAGGSFTLASSVTGTVYIARWDGNAWNALGTGLSSTCRAITINNSDIYAGGDFTTASSVNYTDRIARWSPNSWSPVVQYQTTSSIDNIGVNKTPATNFDISGDIRISGSLSSSSLTGQIAYFGMKIPPAGWLRCSGAEVSRISYVNLFNALVPKSSTVTISIATPAVITWNNHGLSSGDTIYFTTSGSLPTGLTSITTPYYVSASGLSTNTFQVNSAIDVSGVMTSSLVNTSGTQSGTHTAWYAPFGIGNGSTTFTLPDLRGEFIRGWSNNRSVNPNRVFGSFQSDEILSHRHTINGQAADGEAGTGYATAGSTLSGQTISNTTMTYEGGEETRPRNVALLACIKY